VFDQKVTKTWTHGPGVNFTLPVVHHAVGKFYIGVRDKHSILCWTETQEDVKRSVSSKKFQEEIFGIFVLPHSKDLLLSIFSNGTALVLRFDKESLTEVVTLEDLKHKHKMAVIKRVFFLESKEISQPSILLLLEKRNEGHHQLVVAEITEPEAPTISLTALHKLPVVQSVSLLFSSGLFSDHDHICIS
jgi:hypothetical protein